MSFSTIHTRAGLAAMVAAQVSDIPINLTHMAVGDGNGSAVTPVDTQTALVREVYRATINRVYKPDPTGQPTKFAAELVVPASDGGFTMREVGIFDADGTLFAVGNLPETYKPEASEGAFADTIVRLEFMATNADVVTIIADPSIAVASQTWVTNNITAAFLLPGGTTHQVLRKVSNADGDTEWANPTDVNVVVNTIEEIQTLADAQTVVDLVITNVLGLAVYIEGVRLPKQAGVDGWQPHATIVTRLNLGQAYPAGSQIIAVQNEPASDLPEALLKAQNLADLQSKPTARINLDVYSRAEVDQRAPPGLVGHFARGTAPTGWIKANGAEVSRTVYSALFAAIGTTFGVGNGVDTFNLPDLRGEFVRSWDDGRGIDSGRAIGTRQKGTLVAWDQANDAVWQITTVEVGVTSRSTVGADGYVSADYAGASLRGGAIGSSGLLPGRETGSGGYSGITRPRNVALLACIKY